MHFYENALPYSKFFAWKSAAVPGIRFIRKIFFRPSFCMGQSLVRCRIHWFPKVFLYQICIFCWKRTFFHFDRQNLYGMPMKTVVLLNRYICVRCIDKTVAGSARICSIASADPHGDVQHNEPAYGEMTRRNCIIVDYHFAFQKGASFQPKKLEQNVP